MGSWNHYYAMRVRVLLPLGLLRPLTPSCLEVTDFLKLDQHMLELAVHIGFLVTPVLSALFVVRTGAGRTLVVAGSLFSSVSTFLFPLVGHSLFGMMWARALAGAGQGMTIIGLIHLLLLWVPRQEYTRALTLVGGGYYAGMMVADVWGGVISKIYSWQAAFYWFSFVPALLLALWAYVVAPHPALHTTITPTELAYLRANCVAPEPAPLRLRVLAHAPTFWLFVGVTVLYQFAHTVVFSVSPFFVMDVFWVDLSFPVLCVLLVYYNGAAMLFDQFLQKDRADASGKWSRRPREALGCVGLVGAALFLKLFCGISHAPGVRFFAFTIALALFSHAYGGHMAATFEVFPRYVTKRLPPLLLWYALTWRGSLWV